MPNYQKLELKLKFKLKKIKKENIEIAFEWIFYQDKFSNAISICCKKKKCALLKASAFTKGVGSLLHH